MNRTFSFRHILITGGAGFVGANLALCFKQAFPGIHIQAFDNLKRRGSELNLSRLKAMGVEFTHGDIRCQEDFSQVKDFDLLIDCSAEPSVQAGVSGTPLPVIQNNLTGTVHCLEAARKHQAAFLFLSTSRVYPMARLNALAHKDTGTRFAWLGQENCPGLSPEGIAEDFPLEGARSLYGATKLAAELLLQEYAYSYKMPILINRCGILAGPWQMGKVDQGVMTLWVARHYFGKPLRYIGFGGEGKQVRDALHIDDLFDLIVEQARELTRWDGRVYNVGGGTDVSFSLRELTDLCQQLTGRKVPITSEERTSPVDLRIYLTDRRRVTQDFGWSPRRSLPTLVEDVSRWVCEHEDSLRPILN